MNKTFLLQSCNVGIKIAAHIQNFGKFSILWQERFQPVLIFIILDPFYISL